jgi:transcriptional regulator with GAF, ATPase, and Fis domain
MLKESELVGYLSIYRLEVHPFTDKQIELLSNFAKQAVIAIENTRLLNELRQRTDDLSEALEQQTAKSDVLDVISSSPGNLEPVFHTMLQNAIRVCDAKFGILFRYDGDDLGKQTLNAKGVRLHGWSSRASIIPNEPANSSIYRYPADAIIRRVKLYVSESKKR